MPAVRDTVAVLVILAGLLLGAVGLLGWRGALRRNRFVGVRTEATLTSEDAFRFGNRVAAPPLLAAAAVAVLGGGAALGARSAAAFAVVLTIVLAGAAGLTLAAGVLGSRAAALLTPAAGAGRCGGCACDGQGLGACGRREPVAPAGGSNRS